LVFIVTRKIRLNVYQQHRCRQLNSTYFINGTWSGSSAMVTGLWFLYFSFSVFFYHFFFYLFISFIVFSVDLWRSSCNNISKKKLVSSITLFKRLQQKQNHECENGWRTNTACGRVPWIVFSFLAPKESWNIVCENATEILGDFGPSFGNRCLIRFTHGKKEHYIFSYILFLVIFNIILYVYSTRKHHDTIIVNGPIIKRERIHSRCTTLPVNN